MKRPVARLATKSAVIAVVSFALFLALVGQPTRADVIDVITSPISASPPVCEALLWIASLGSISGACPVEPSIRPPQPVPAPPEPIRCTPARFTGPPTFFRNPVVTVKYHFHGSCSHANLPDAPAINYRFEGSWTPGETNPNKPNASESVEITGYEPYMPDRGPGGRIFMYWTARCHREPWLSPEEAACQRLGSYIPDDLRAAVPGLHALGSFPKTRYAIPPNDRQQWYAHYLRLTGPVAARKATPLQKQPSVVPQTTPLPPPSVMQAPAPGSSAPAQMNRSPFMIMPRGVEEKGSGQRHETGDTTAEIEKKP